MNKKTEMKKWIVSLISAAFLISACSHNPPKPSGSEFPLNDVKYYKKIKVI